MIQFRDIYRNRKVLLTGHTGFKGSWLSLWLTELGAKVIGLSLTPETEPNHWDLLQLGVTEYLVDIRDMPKVLEVFEREKPDIVFHLAAQPLVRRSYRNPLDTWSTNVMGTANILDVCRQTKSVSAIVIVTTDKVYENKEWYWGYRENDTLGGHDPYSSSKAASELVVTSYRKAFFNYPGAPLVATARAGNTIGGGDWSEDRLIPDIIRSIEKSTPIKIRSPDATRPWQHVLDCLSGYLLLGQCLLEEKRIYADSWNFGPNPLDNTKVIDILKIIQNIWADLEWFEGTEEQPHEANSLYLDNTKSRVKLGWVPVLDLEQTIKYTLQWYSDYYSTGCINSCRQVNNYIKMARLAGCSWIAE